MVTLNEKESEQFLQKVEEGLNNPIGPVPTPKVDKAIEQVMKDKKKPFLCKLRLHFYKDKLILDHSNVKKGVIPFALKKICRRCDYIKYKVTGTMS